jgi:putative ABC transport system ATP-binding protein
MIRLTSVSRTVRSGTEDLTILHPLDLEVPGGQFLVITGASGSGKSTLLSLIAGLDAPTTGEILIDGKNLTQMSEDDLADLRGATIGFIFQSFHLVPSLTAYEAVLVPMELAGADDAAERAQQLIDAVGLRDRGHHYPSQLSGGEQQRVAIARAFANSPRLLLADEPTGNLDSRTGAHVFELLIDLNRDHKTTLVLVTHESALAARADRIIALSEGRLITDTVGDSERNGAGRWAPASEASEGGSGGSARSAEASGRYSPRQ